MTDSLYGNIENKKIEPDFYIKLYTIYYSHLEYGLLFL